MTTCFYLLPGARLPEAAAREAVGTLRASDPASLEAWTALGAGREPPGVQRLAEPLHARSPHQAWLWKVLTHRTGAPITAPYEWIASGGPVLDQEFWKLTPWRRAAGGRIEPLRIPEADIPLAACALDPVAAAAGLRLMISGSSFFLCRRTPWALSAMPFEDLSGTADADPLEHLTGEDKPAAVELMKTLAEAARKTSGDLSELDGFWLSGGGEYAPIFPPSTYRSVVCDDSTVLAWAAAAGIPRAVLLPAHSRERDRIRHEKAYAQAPIGDRIVVLDGLFEPWRCGDWAAWREALPKVLADLALWRGREKAAGIDSAVFVFFGTDGAATLMPSPKSLNPLKLFKRSVLPLESWFVDNFAGEGA